MNPGVLPPHKRVAFKRRQHATAMAFVDFTTQPLAPESKGRLEFSGANRPRPRPWPLPSCLTSTESVCGFIPAETRPRLTGRPRRPAIFEAVPRNSREGVWESPPLSKGEQNVWKALWVVNHSERGCLAFGLEVLDRKLRRDESREQDSGERVTHHCTAPAAK